MRGGLLLIFVVVLVLACGFADAAKKKKQARTSTEEATEMLKEAISEQASGAAGGYAYNEYAQQDAGAAAYGGGYEQDEGTAPAASYIDLPPLMARISLRKVLFDGRTDLQEAKVVEAPFFGRILILDGDLMMTERDEFHYHEMMAHVPLAYLPKASRVLIIGGGDGGLALQVLQHPRIANVTQVEIDKGVVELCEKYIPSTARVYKSKRMNLVIADGAKFVADMCENDTEKFDLVIVDSTDAGPAFPLATQEFYTNVKKCALRPPGIFIFNMQSASWGTKNLGERAANVSAIYKNAFVYQVFQPTYASGHYAIMFASDNVHPLKTPIDWEVAGVNRLPYKYWTPDVHYAAFMLPNFVRKEAPKSAASIEDIASPYHWTNNPYESHLHERDD